MFERITRLENVTNFQLHLKEHQEKSPVDLYSHQITVDPRSRESLPSAKYRNRNRDGGRSSRIVLFLGDVEYKKTLTPEIFLRYSQLNFELINGSLLKVTGLLPSKIWCRGWAGRFQSTETPRVFEEVFVTEAQVIGGPNQSG